MERPVLRKADIRPDAEHPVEGLHGCLLGEHGQALLQLLTAHPVDARFAARSLLYRLGRICSRAGGLVLVLIDEGGKFLGRPRGEGLFEKIQERGYASA
jgi:hypothetical protein